LIRADNHYTTMVFINAESFVGASMTVNRTFIVNEDFIAVYN